MTKRVYVKRNKRTWDVRLRRAGVPEGTLIEGGFFSREAAELAAEAHRERERAELENFAAEARALNPEAEVVVEEDHVFVRDGNADFNLLALPGARLRPILHGKRIK